MTRSRCLDRFPSRTPEACSNTLSESRTRVALSPHHTASYPRETHLGCSISLPEAYQKLLQGLVGGVFLMCEYIVDEFPNCWYDFFCCLVIVIISESSGIGSLVHTLEIESTRSASCETISLWYSCNSLEFSIFYCIICLIMEYIESS